MIQQMFTVIITIITVNQNYTQQTITNLQWGGLSSNLSLQGTDEQLQPDMAKGNVLLFFGFTFYADSVLCDIYPPPFPLHTCVWGKTEPPDR